MRKPRVALLLSPAETPYHGSSLCNLPPLALGVLSGYLREGNCDVDLFDLNVRWAAIGHQYSAEALQPIYDKDAVCSYLNGEHHEALDAFTANLLDSIDLSSYDMVGISCGADFSWLQMHTGFLLGAHVARHYGKTVAFGGNNITYLAMFPDVFHELWETVTANFQYVIVGPGERALETIAQAVAANPAVEHPIPVPGMVSMLDGQFFIKQKDQPQVVKPDWRGLDMNFYLNTVVSGDTPQAERLRQVQIFKWPFFLTTHANSVYSQLKSGDYMGKLVLPFIFQYNCPYNCTFCIESAGDRKRVIIDNPVSVVDAIEEMMKTYGTNYFFFFNNYFNMSRKFARDFCDEVKRRGLVFFWSDCGRFNNLDEDLLIAMRDAGCAKLTFGLETASPKVLELIDKKVPLEKAEEILQVCKKVGIWSDLEIIVGLPYEYDEDFGHTRRFIIKNREYINHFNLNEFFVVPESMLGAFPERYGIQLVRTRRTYQEVLDMNYKWLLDGGDRFERPENFQIYTYDEIGGRNHTEVIKSAGERVAALKNLHNPEFTEAWWLLETIYGNSTPRTTPKEVLS